MKGKVKMNIIVHTKTNCPWCDMAKEWLTEHGFEYSVIIHDDDAERQEFYERCGNEVRTVPQIFVDEERIGGYQDLIHSNLQDIKAIKFDEEF